MGPQESVESLARMLRAWHLAVLRFAVTLDNADRLNVFATAHEIDKLGRREEESNFGFFRKTSAELTAAILRPSESGDALLRQYLARIGDMRLERALAAALGIEREGPAEVRRHS